MKPALIRARETVPNPVLRTAVSTYRSSACTLRNSPLSYP